MDLKQSAQWKNSAIGNAKKKRKKKKRSINAFHFAASSSELRRARDALRAANARTADATWRADTLEAKAVLTRDKLAAAEEARAAATASLERQEK